MNYSRIYSELIERAKTRSISGYSEKHHIIPKCMNGTDDSENIVKLTAREHFIAHLLLYKIHKSHSLLMAIRAFQMHGRINSKKFELLRLEFSKAHSQFMTEFNSKHGNPFKGCTHSVESKAKMSKAASKRTGSLNSFYGKSHSKESIEKIIAKNAEFRANNTIKLPPRTKEHIAKIVETKRKNYELYGSPLKGKPKPKRSIDRFKQTHRDTVGKRTFAQICMKTGEVVRTFDYLADVREQLGIGTSNISKALQGKIKYSGGYYWKYLEETK